MKNSWTKTEAANATGLTARTIHFYTDEGLVIPEIAFPRGKGTTRKYSARNLVEFLIISELVKCGLTLKNIKHVMEMVKNQGLFSLEALEAWNPNQPVRGRWYLLLYDPTMENGVFQFFEVEDQKDIILDFEPFASAIVVDVTSAVEKIRAIL